MACRPTLVSTLCMTEFMGTKKGIGSSQQGPSRLGCVLGPNLEAGVLMHTQACTSRGPASDGPRVGLELGLSTDGPYCGGFVAGEKEESEDPQHHHGDSFFSFCRSPGWAFDPCFLLVKQRQQSHGVGLEGNPDLLGAR